MRLNRPAPRPQHETIVPLIDVVFFLLVFFMLVGRLDATSPFELAPPVAQTGMDMPGGGATLTVSPDGQLAVDGTAMPQPQALDLLATRLAAQPGLFIRVNAHRDAELRRVLPLLATLEAIGARDVALVVTPDADANP